MEKSCIWNFKVVENKSRRPKSWEEFCETQPIKDEEYFVSSASIIANTFSRKGSSERLVVADSNVLPDRATAEAVLTLCQLIQLRNCYNGDWKPSYEEDNAYYFIDLTKKEPVSGFAYTSPSILYFKNREIRDEFLRNFRLLIKKLKPLYGIKEGGEK